MFRGVGRVNRALTLPILPDRVSGGWSVLFFDFNSRLHGITSGSCLACFVASMLYRGGVGGPIFFILCYRVLPVFVSFVLFVSVYL